MCRLASFSTLLRVCLRAMLLASLLPILSAFVPRAVVDAEGPADAKVEIVFPHDGAPVTGASLANIEVYVLQRGTLTPVGQDFSNSVILWAGLNNDPANQIGPGEKTIVTRDGVTFPIWVFNDVDVSLVVDPINKYFLSLTVDGVPTYSNVWAHGVNGLTRFPQRDTLAFVGVVPPTDTTGLRYGMQAELFSQDQRRLLGLIRGAGFNWVKQQVRWAEVEPSPGAIDFSRMDAVATNASAQGVNVLFSVVTSPTWAREDHIVHGPPDDPADLARFVSALASRYKGRVQAYEIWNEQNLEREWGGQPVNPGAYVELLKPAYNAIKQADPQALVLSGGLTPTGLNDPNVAVDDQVYLVQMYEYQSGIIHSFADGIGAHMSGYNNAPEDWVNSIP